MKPLVIGGSFALAFMLFMAVAFPSLAEITAVADDGAGKNEEKAAEAKDATAGEKAKADEKADAGAGANAEVDPKRQKFSELLKSAQDSFAKRDMAEALKTLEEVPEEFRGEAEFLTLRGSCHIFRKDFEPALKDFQAAARKAPHVESCRFNLAEAYFVTKRWDEAVRELKRVKPQAGPGFESISTLVAFKLMLCEEGRGDAKEFDRQAKANMADPNALLGIFTQAAMQFRDGKKDEGKKTVAGAAKRFPKAEDRVPWIDTMIEFGYDPR